MRRHFQKAIFYFILAGISWELEAYNESDLAALKATNECEKCDLRSVDLSKIDLTEANLKLVWKA